MNQFKTALGVVSLSKPYWSFSSPTPVVDVIYKPDDYNGWGISKAFDVELVANFNQENAEHFAQTVEPKLRDEITIIGCDLANGKDSSVTTQVKACQHGVLLYGNACLSCEREAEVNA